MFIHMGQGAETQPPQPQAGEYTSEVTPPSLLSLTPYTHLLASLPMFHYVSII